MLYWIDNCFILVVTAKACCGSPHSTWGGGDDIDVVGWFSWRRGGGDSLLVFRKRQHCGHYQDTQIERG